MRMSVKPTKNINTTFFRAHDLGKVPFWMAEKMTSALLAPRLEHWLGLRPQRAGLLYDHKKGLTLLGKTSEWQNLNTRALDHLQTDPYFGEQVVSNIKRLARQIYNLSYDVIQRRSLSFPRRGAQSRIEHLFSILEEMNQYLSFVIMLDAPSGTFSQQLKSIIIEHAHERVLSRPPSEYLRVLLEPVEFSFAEQQHDELLLLAQAVRRRPPMRKLIAHGGNPRDILNEMTQKYAPLARKLRRHIRHYSWIITVGGGIEDAPARLLTELQQLVKTDFNLDQAIEEREQSIRLRHDQQRLLVRELGLTEEERHMFNLARDFYSSGRHGKEMLLLFQSVVYDLVLTHIKNRSPEELALLSATELSRLLSHNTFDKDTHTNRRAGFIFLAGGANDEWLLGAKLDAWKVKNLGKK